MEEERSISFPAESTDENNHGWQKVTYVKKQRKNQPKTVPDHATAALPNGSTEKNGVFNSLEKHAAERRRKLEAQRASAAVYDDYEIPLRSRKKWGDEEDGYVSSDADVDAKEINTAGANEKEKPKKVKKPKVTLAEAAAKINDSDLASFLSDVSESYEGKQDIQLMRFADYFGRAFSAVSASQFPWLKLLREYAVLKYADIPVSYVPEAVYKTSIDWINHHSCEALENFLLWSLDSILQDLAIQQPASKGSKKGGPPPSSKSQWLLKSRSSGKKM